MKSLSLMTVHVLCYSGSKIIFLETVDTIVCSCVVLIYFDTASEYKFTDCVDCVIAHDYPRTETLDTNLSFVLTVC